jgi:hypothetical protein
LPCEGLCIVRQGTEVDVDLIDAAILDVRRHGGDGGLEQARVVAIGVEVDRQQDRVGRQLRRLHHAHAGEHAQRPRLVGRGGDHAAPDVVAHPGKSAAAVGEQFRLVDAAPADHHRLAAQLGIAQQLDRGIEGVHVQVCDAARGHIHGRVKIPETQFQWRLMQGSHSRRRFGLGLPE